jgi:hypothetical protein
VGYGGRSLAQQSLVLPGYARDDELDQRLFQSFAREVVANLERRPFLILQGENHFWLAHGASADAPIDLLRSAMPKGVR